MTDQKIRFAKALSALAEYYGKELSDGVIALYWQGLSQYGIADLEAAIGRHLQNPDTGQWMPKIADIVRMIDGTTKGAAVMAWATTMRRRWPGPKPCALSAVSGSTSRSPSTTR